MWRAWLVQSQQADTPIPMVEAGTRQSVPRRWLALGVEPPEYAVDAGPVEVADIAAALAWAESVGYMTAPSWGSEVV